MQSRIAFGIFRKSIGLHWSNHWAILLWIYDGECNFELRPILIIISTFNFPVRHLAFDWVLIILHLQLPCTLYFKPFFSDILYNHYWLLLFPSSDVSSSDRLGLVTKWNPSSQRVQGMLTYKQKPSNFEELQGTSRNLKKLHRTLRNFLCC